jgi:hypothetical protein
MPFHLLWRISGFFEFSRKREKSGIFCFQKFCKPLSAQIQKKIEDAPLAAPG